MYIQNLEGLERLRLVIGYMPDETLMRKLKKERGLGHNDYPVRGIWNAMLAGIVYQHCSVNSLIREFLRIWLRIFLHFANFCIYNKPLLC